MYVSGIYPSCGLYRGVSYTHCPVKNSVDYNNTRTCQTSTYISQHLNCFGKAQAESSQDTKSSLRTLRGKSTYCQIGLDMRLVNN